MGTLKESNKHFHITLKRHSVRFLSYKRDRQIVVAILGLLATFWVFKSTRQLRELHYPQPQCLKSNPISPPKDWASQRIDWHQYAYVQYVTNPTYLCNSVMLFESLDRMGSKAERLLLYPSHFSLDPETVEGRLLHRAREEYDVKLEPIQIQNNGRAGRKLYLCSIEQSWKH